MTTLIPKFDLKDGGATPTGAVNRLINEKLAEIVSVKDFGAVGDGITDDTTAIQAAITYAQSLFYKSGGSTVFFPAGRYVTSNTLTVTRTINFLGEGSTTSTIEPTSALAGPCLQWGVDGDTPRPAYASVIEKIGFYGQNTTNSAADGIAMWASHTEIKDCIISEFAGNGIYAFESWSNSVNNCYIRLNDLNGIKIYDACNIFVISNCYILSNGNNGILVNAGNKVVIENNDIENNQYSGLFLYNIATTAMRSISVLNNYFETNNGAGSYPEIYVNQNSGEISGLIISDNYFESPTNISIDTYEVSGGCVIANNISTSSQFWIPRAFSSAKIFSENNAPYTTVYTANNVYSPGVYYNEFEGYVVNGRISRFAVNTQEGTTKGTLWSVSGRYASSPFPTITVGTTTQVYGSAAPTTGANVVGNIVWNTTPTAGGNIGWVCTTAGTPGTWKTFGAIAA